MSIPDVKTFVTHLECSETGQHYAPDRLYNLSDAGKPLLVRYDLDAINASLSKDQLDSRAPELWRYRELLPVRQRENVVRLGEIMTPILAIPSLKQALNMTHVSVKDEGRLPTGSFKARGIALAVSMAKELGVKCMAMPTNGNAGAALAAYCSNAGIESYVICPEDTPEINVHEIAFQGARTWLANGLINDCGKVVGAGVDSMKWFDTSTLKEPYRIEGKKTMGLELAEQLEWQLPDVILYPTGGGTGLIGMWKAFMELEAIGWISAKKPRMVAVQASGCAPIVRAFENGQTHADLWQNAHTVAAGIRVPGAIGDFLILEAIRESNGFATAVDDDAILEVQARIAHEDGILLCPEGAATAAALIKEVAAGRIAPNETVLMFNCATGLKYPMPGVHHQIDVTKPVDFDSMAQQ